MALCLVENQTALRLIFTMASLAILHPLDQRQHEAAELCERYHGVIRAGRYYQAVACHSPRCRRGCHSASGSGTTVRPIAAMASKACIPLMAMRAVVEAGMASAEITMTACARSAASMSM